MKNKFDLLTGRNNPYLFKYEDALVHSDIISSFKALQVMAREEIGAEIKIISSFRDYKQQENIWNLKATGKRVVLDDNEVQVKREDMSPSDFIECIMRYSAIPGLSRHHWGTDIDIYDASKLDKKLVQLVGSESDINGPFFKLHEWLDLKIKNNDSFGFFRPYDKDLGGIAVEKWHLSFAPISQGLYENYTLQIFEENISQSKIELKDIILNNLDYYFQKYFKRIVFP